MQLYIPWWSLRADGTEARDGRTGTSRTSRRRLVCVKLRWKIGVRQRHAGPGRFVGLVNHLKNKRVKKQSVVLHVVYSFPIWTRPNNSQQIAFNGGTFWCVPSCYIVSGSCFQAVRSSTFPRVTQWNDWRYASRYFFEQAHILILWTDFKKADKNNFQVGVSSPLDTKNAGLIANSHSTWNFRPRTGFSGLESKI